MEVTRNTPYRTLLHTFQGHQDEINRIAWSPNGHYLASASFDKTVRIWDVRTKTLQHTLQGHSGYVYSVAWSPDGHLLASSSQDKTILGWDVRTQSYFPSPIGRHDGNVYDIAWLLSNGAFLASCSEDQTVRVWGTGIRSVRSSRIKTLRGHACDVFCLSQAPGNNVLASGSSQGLIRLWDTSLTQMGGNVDVSQMGENIDSLRSNKLAVYSLAWSPDAQFLASGSEDSTIQVWRFKWQLKPEIVPVSTLEWHTGPITSICFSRDCRLLASKSRDGTICLWRTDTWERVETIEAPTSNGVFAGLAFHPGTPLLATLGDKDMSIQVWQLDIPGLLGLTPKPTVYYMTAKVVLAGDSSVGKTALGKALVGLPYTNTASTHGRYVRTFKSFTASTSEGKEEQREIFLWDLAGQSSYRLVHQLHLPEAAVVLLVFCDKDGGDPLSGVRYWIRALQTIQETQFGVHIPTQKLLVEARIDRGSARLSSEQIKKALQDWATTDYFQTSAKEGRGIAELANAIQKAIEWDLLPRVSSTELFQNIKTFLITRKDAGYVIVSSNNLYNDYLIEKNILNAPSDLHAQFETCIMHLEAQGLLRRFSFGGIVLLQPEKLDDYTSALVNAVRAERDSLGSIAESTVLTGNFFDMSHDIRLDNREDEKFLLLALVQDLLDYEIALRESSYLVFPTEVMRQDIDLLEPPGRAIVFIFEGPVLNVYATLVVRLAHSGLFRKKVLWQNAVVFSSLAGGEYGCVLRIIDEGQGELTLFFDKLASEETRYHFEQYVQSHLDRQTPGNWRRQRIFVCSICQTALSDNQIAKGRERGRTHLGCPLECEMIDIRDGLERLEQPPISRVQEMDRVADAHKELEVARSILQGKEQTKDYDVYFSYNQLDEQAAIEIREQLKARGILPWVATWDLLPGLPRQQQMDQHIEQMRAAAVLIGRYEMSRQSRLEVESLINQFLERNCPVIPVFLPDAPQNIQLPSFLQNMVEVDFRKQDPDPLERLIQGIQNRRV